MIMALSCGPDRATSWQEDLKRIVSRAHRAARSTTWHTLVGSGHLLHGGNSSLSLLIHTLPRPHLSFIHFSCNPVPAAILQYSTHNARCVFFSNIETWPVKRVSRTARWTLCCPWSEVILFLHALFLCLFGFILLLTSPARYKTARPCRVAITLTWFLFAKWAALYFKDTRWCLAVGDGMCVQQVGHYWESRACMCPHSYSNVTWM